MMCKCGNPVYCRLMCRGCYNKQWKHKQGAKYRRRAAELALMAHYRRNSSSRKILGLKCAFPKCGSSRNLRIHHNHVLQKRLSCCRYRNGCSRCQICMLCHKHNTMLGMLSDSMKIVRQVIAFLRRFH